MLMGVDLGTTGCKAVVFDPEGRVRAMAYREYPLHFPRPGWIELDSRRVMNAARETIREASSKARVTALAVSSQGEAVTPVALDGDYLDRAIVTFDARTASWPAWWEKRISRSRVYRITGMPLHGMYTASKILWWKKARPDVFRMARQFLCFEDLLFHELGLPPSIDSSLAARTMLFDVERRRWSDEMLRIAGLDPGRLAAPVEPGAIVGEVGKNSFGLPRGTVAVAGGHDQPCGALGAGVVEPGAAMYATGTVECIAPAFAGRFSHPELVRCNIACYPHVVPGLWNALAFNFTGGSLLRWYRDVFGNEEKRAANGRDVYDLLIESAWKKPTSLFVLPHFTATGTPHLDTESKGVIAGLRLSTTRGEIVRALLEGVTFEMALNVEILRRCGARIDSFRAVGGGSRSAAWMRIKADVLGRPVSTMNVPEAACLGAAILAGTATGVYRTAKEGARAVSRIARTFRPVARRVRRYAERLALYREFYPTLNGWLHRI
jgi:xylulokinase